MVKEFGKSALKWVLLLSMVVTAVNIQIGMASAEGQMSAAQQSTDQQPADQQPVIQPPVNQQPTADTMNQLLENQLTLKKNSSIMIYKGQEIKAVQPLTIKNGTYYVALNGIASPYGYKTVLQCQNEGNHRKIQYEGISLQNQ